MFCAQCGSANPDEAKFCAKCGRTLQTAASPASGTVPQPAAPAEFIAPPTTSGKAVASLICGFLFFFLPAALAAIVLGHLSLTDIRKSAGRLTGHGIAVAGLILGYLGVCLIPLLLILAAIVIPNLLRSRMAADQASAVGSLRTIDVAAFSYMKSYDNGFPPSLGVLAGTGDPSCDHAGLIDGVLASGQKNGYLFTYQRTTGDQFSPAPKSPPSGCSSVGGSAFSVTADPITPGTSGQASYYTDQTGIVRFETSGAATANSPPIAGRE
jgi:type II secretory pathway pseudopilin PulG